MRKGKLKQIFLHTLLLVVGLVIIPLVGYAVSISGSPTTSRTVETRGQSTYDNTVRERKSAQTDPSQARKAQLSKSGFALADQEVLILTPEELGLLKDDRFPVPQVGTEKPAEGSTEIYFKQDAVSEANNTEPAQQTIVISYQPYYDHYPHRCGRFYSSDCEGPSPKPRFFRADPGMNQNYYMYHNFYYGWP